MSERKLLSSKENLTVRQSCPRVGHSARPCSSAGLAARAAPEEEAFMTPTASQPSASAAVLTSIQAQTMARSERRRINRQAVDLPSACVVISLVEPVLLPV